MLNTISIHGRLASDPKKRETATGVSVCNFSVAVQRDYEQNGERPCDFFNCVAWRGLADMICNHFGKGKEIVVHGSMQSRKWVDNDGNNRISWEIQADNIDFCGSKSNAVNTDDNDNTDVFDDVPFI